MPPQRPPRRREQLQSEPRATPNREITSWKRARSDLDETNPRRARATERSARSVECPARLRGWRPVKTAAPAENSWACQGFSWTKDYPLDRWGSKESLYFEKVLAMPPAREQAAQSSA
ncbi:unnamed protein product [Prorocentrum cordatum]|uniref:Uncharacterized protein n=1 Tax=Prorocentrum cordatum TaxID=2364126 RepID=A0ABN9VEM5_9DINO|nr:unnamed protein product [Polarella glacialis]